jgi:hypothetical protein
MDYVKKYSSNCDTHNNWMGTSLHILYSVFIDIDEVYTFRGDTNYSTELNNFKILLRNSLDLRK